MCKIYGLFGDAIDALGLKNVRKIECFAQEAQTFDQDGIHLTPDSGTMFVESILVASEAFFW